MLWFSVALAGSGPWVVSEGDGSLYLGTDTQRIEKLALSAGSLDKEALVDVDEGLSKLGVQGIFSYGILPNFEMTLGVPYQHVRANRQDGEICASLGTSACATTSGLGILTTQLKYQLLNEVYGPPLSLTVGAELRYGDFTADTRGRLTNLGEGTVDIGPLLSVGRSGGMGASGYWYSFLDVGWRYRFPTVEEGKTRYPGSEWVGEWDLSLVPNGTLGVGPAMSLFWRPAGVDFEDADLSDVDRFSSLRVMNLQAGAKVAVRSSRNITFNAACFRTLYAVNNPLITSVSVGLSFTNLRRVWGAAYVPSG